MNPNHIKMARKMLRKEPERANQILYNILDEGNDRNDLIQMILDRMTRDEKVMNVTVYLSNETETSPPKKAPTRKKKASK